MVRNALLYIFFLWMLETAMVMASSGGSAAPGSNKGIVKAEETSGGDADKDAELPEQESDLDIGDKPIKETGESDEENGSRDTEAESAPRPSVADHTKAAREDDLEKISPDLPETPSGKTGTKKEIKGSFPFAWMAAGFAAGVLAVLFISGVLRWMSGKHDENAREYKEDDRRKSEEQSEGIFSGRYQSTEIRLPSANGLPDITKGTIGQIYNVGRRKNQQDNFGTKVTRLGLLSVVSDGMGGLSDGDKVSEKAVMGMFQASGTVKSGHENPLFMMAGSTNQQITQMLGPEKVYKCGATLLAVLVNNGSFHWVSVGDSRIYFYCGRHLIQMNREHIYKWQLLQGAVNQGISFSAVNSDSQRSRLVSFLGMGDLKAIDGSLRPVRYQPGDKLLLMSDGVFNTISETEIISVLESTKNAAQAAKEMEHRILAANNPNQDNFTCIILDL